MSPAIAVAQSAAPGNLQHVRSDDNEDTSIGVMVRRTFLGTLTGGFLAGPLAVRAQQARSDTSPVHVDVLGYGTGVVPHLRERVNRSPRRPSASRSPRSCSGRIRSSSSDPG